MKNPLDLRGQPAQQTDKRPGSAPGLLVAPEGSPIPRVDVLISGDGQWNHLKEVPIPDLAKMRSEQPKGQWIWVDVNGLGDAQLIAEIGHMFGLHRLSLEDAMNLHQRPKTETYDEMQYTVLQVPYIKDGELEFEQVSLFLGKTFLISLQANPKSQLNAICQRFERGAPRLTGSQVDYLFYVAMDALVDQVFPVLEFFDRKIEELEEWLLSGETRSIVQGIHDLREEVMVLRRILWNQSMVPDYLLKMQQEWLASDTRPYLRDVQDHAVRALGLADQLKDSSTGLYDLQHSVNSTQLNEVMKVLTILSTLFLPMTFIAGVYGMNFNPEASPWNMPELSWKYGYLFAWGLMLCSVALMLWLFRHFGWIGGKARGKRWKNTRRRRRR